MAELPLETQAFLSTTRIILQATALVINMIFSFNIQSDIAQNVYKYSMNGG